MVGIQLSSFDFDFKKFDLSCFKLCFLIEMSVIEAFVNHCLLLFYDICRSSEILCTADRIFSTEFSQQNFDIDVYNEW